MNKNNFGIGNEYGCGQKKDDWTQDFALTTATCSEEGCQIDKDQPFWAKNNKTLCADCITMILNARMDYIKELENELEKEHNE